jgi:putative membrane protein
MIINYRLNLLQLLNSIKKYWILFGIYVGIVVILYELFEIRWLAIPWQVLTVVGIAVSFYLGFKNNSSYERTWEARKIWGAIVNSSRSYGNMVKNFIGEKETEQNREQVNELKKQLIYRHIAWLYQLRRQLWTPRQWEHDQKHIRRTRKVLMKKFAPLSIKEELTRHLSPEEVEDLMKKTNIATHLISKQSDQLEQAAKKGWIDSYRHVAMQGMLTDFYTQQGKCERIKNFPFPRQYSSFSFFFVIAFILLLPLGLMPIFKGFGEHYIWISIPFTVLIGMIFWLMELVGDYAENPFSGWVTDIPMTSLCSAIEIDLKEMIGAEDEVLPVPKPLDGVIM